MLVIQREYSRKLEVYFRIHKDFIIQFYTSDTGANILVPDRSAGPMALDYCRQPTIFIA